jgi:hypothetical protein
MIPRQPEYHAASWLLPFSKQIKRVANGFTASKTFDYARGYWQ